MAAKRAGRGQPRLPPPDKEFAKCRPPLLDPYPRDWVRLAAIARPTAFDWDDRVVSRFSHPGHPLKILYLADSKETAFWEVFGAAIEDMPVDDRGLSQRMDLQPRQWIKFNLPPTLRLIDVTKPLTIHALRSNAGTWLSPYRHCQAWARALMDHPIKLDGFIFQSCRRGGDSHCLALFSRPDEATMELFLSVKRVPRIGIDRDPDVLRILVEHNIDLR